MAVTGWKTASSLDHSVTSPSIPELGTDDWSDGVGFQGSAQPGDVSADDAEYVTNFWIIERFNGSTVSFNHPSWLRLHDFGFTDTDIPVGSTIDGIEVELLRYHTSFGDDLYESYVHLSTSANAVVGDNKGDGVNPIPSTDTIATYGGPADNWNASLTDTDVKATTFGIHYLPTLLPSIYTADNGLWEGGTFRLNRVRVRVHYTPPVNNDWLPSDAQSANLELWLDPTTNLVTSGSDVTQITSRDINAFVFDLDGGSSNLTTTLVNGNVAVTDPNYGGSRGLINTDANVDAWTTGDSSQFVWFDDTNLGSGTNPWIVGVGVNNAYIRQLSTGAFRLAEFSGFGVYDIASASWKSGGNGAHIVQLNYDLSTEDMVVDFRAGDYTETAANHGTASGSLDRSTYAGTTNFGLDDIVLGDWIVYDAILDDQEAAAASGYLFNKYASGFSDTSHPHAFSAPQNDSSSLYVEDLGGGDIGAERGFNNVLGISPPLAQVVAPGVYDYSFIRNGLSGNTITWITNGDNTSALANIDSVTIGSDVCSKLTGPTYNGGTGRTTMTFDASAAAAWTLFGNLENNITLQEGAGPVAPDITTAIVQTNTENTVLSIALVATGDPVDTWAITGGTDQAQFEINGTTLRWASNGTGPAAGSYAVEITATNTGGSDIETITVTVEAAPVAAPLQKFKATQGSVAGFSPTTTFGQLSIASDTPANDVEVENTDGAFTWNPATGRLILPSGAQPTGYIITGMVDFRATHNNRYNLRGRWQQISGNGSALNLTTSGYARNNGNPRAVPKFVTIVTGMDPGAEFEMELARSQGSGSPAGNINNSSVEVTPFWADNVALFLSQSGIFPGGTTEAPFTGYTTVSNTDPVGIVLASGQTITLGNLNKRYLILGGNYAEGIGGRTQRFNGITEAGALREDMLGYSYSRDNSNDDVGEIYSGIVNVTGTSKAIENVGFRGPSTYAAGNAAAPVEYNSTGLSNGYHGIAVIELSDDTEVFSSNNVGASAQGMASNGNTDVSVVNTVDLADATSFAKTSATAMNVVATATVLAGANIAGAYYSNHGTRLSRGIELTIDGAGQSSSFAHDYGRGSQGSNSTYGWGASTVGWLDISAGQDIGVHSVDGGDDGNVDVVTGRAGFWGINVDTMVPAAPPSGISGTASGTIDFTGDSDGRVTISGVGSGDMDFTGLSTGNVLVEGNGSGVLPLTGTGIGVVLITGAATGNIEFTGASTGVVSSDITGSASGTIAFAGNSDGQVLIQGTSTGDIDFTGAATGEALIRGTAVGLLDFASSAEATVQIRGVASGSIDFTGVALGHVCPFDIYIGVGDVDDINIGSVPFGLKFIGVKCRIRYLNVVDDAQQTAVVPRAVFIDLDNSGIVPRTLRNENQVDVEISSG